MCLEVADLGRSLNCYMGWGGDLLVGGAGTVAGEACGLCSAAHAQAVLMFVGCT